MGCCTKNPPVRPPVNSLPPNVRLDSDILLFVNASSGGNLAGTLLEAVVKKQQPTTTTTSSSAAGGSSGTTAAALEQEGSVVLHLGESRYVRVRIYDIRDGKSGNKPGFLLLASQVAKAKGNSRPRLIAAGGDGTVMWCISELQAHHIHLESVCLGVMPFGTGNDFARALGWMLPMSALPFNDLSYLAELWSAAEEGGHDIWEVDIQLKEDGRFMQVSSKDRVKEIMFESEGVHKTRMTLKMGNYFSVGVESRIGIGFDKKRTTSAMGNKIMYASEGLKKSLFTSTSSTDQIIHHVSSDSEPEPIIFTTAPSRHPLLSHSVSLIAINIPSFASGLDIWGHSKSSSIEGKPKLCTDLPQVMGDGKIEMVTFPSVTALGAEVVAGGNARRVHQGAGPFTLVFNDLPEDEKVYFQVDGEFFVMIRPTKVILRHSSRISVLRKR